MDLPCRFYSQSKIIIAVSRDGHSVPRAFHYLANLLPPTPKVGNLQWEHFHALQAKRRSSEICCGHSSGMDF
jgi:hypothetical protein